MDKTNFVIRHAYIGNEIITYKLFVRNTKNSYIRTTRNNQIEVIASTYMSDKQLNEFVKAHIYKMHSHIKKRENKALIDLNNNFIHILNQRYELKEVKSSRKKYEIINNVIYLHIKNSSDKLFLVKKIYLDKVTPLIKTWFAHWEKIMNLEAELSFKWLNSKWGCCQVRSKHVTLSLKLCAFKKEMIDYVIVHELAHIVHPNHSPKFWQYLSQFIPNWKEIKNIINLR